MPSGEKPASVKEPKRGRRPYKPEEISPDTRADILTTARLLFAAKGYDGVSAAEIAERAGVNKALVFYYFGSKENILKAVLNQAAEEVAERRALFLREKNPTTEQTITEYLEESVRTMEARKEVVRILMLETVKGTENVTGDILFDFLEKSMRELPVKNSESGHPDGKQDKHLTTEFFFDIMPLFSFVALEEKWAAHLGADRKTVRQDFMEVFNDIYLKYIRRKYYSNFEGVQNQ